MPASRTLSSTLASLAAAAAVAGLAACSGMRTGPVPTAADFAAIPVGTPRAQVEARFGPPTWVFGTRLNHLTVLNYRVSHSDCTIHQVSLNPDGTVHDTGTAFDNTLCGGPG